MADTAALVVALSAQLTKFEKDMKDAVKIADTQTRAIENRFSQMNTKIEQEFSSFISRYSAAAGPLGGILSSIGPIGLTVAAGIGAATLAVGFLIDKTDQFVTKQKAMKEAAETTGLTLDQLKALGQTATAVGVDFDKAERGIERLSVSIDDLRTKGTGPLFDTLSQINPALVRQVANADSTAEAIDILAKSYAGLGSQFEKNAFASDAFGKRQIEVGRILQDIADKGGLQALASNLAAAGKSVDKELNERVVALKREIDEIKKRTDNLWGSAFSTQVLQAQKESASYWEAVAKYVNQVSKDFESGESVFGAIFGLRSLRTPTVSGNAGQPNLTVPQLTVPPRGGQTAAGATGKAEGEPNPPAVQNALNNVTFPNINSILQTADAIDKQKANTAIALTFQQRYNSAIGDAVTQEELLRAKKLELNKAIQENTIDNSAAQRALSAFNVAQQENLVALRQRLGVASEDEILQAKLARIQLDVNKGILDNTEAERARARAVKESKEAYEGMIVAGSRLPELTRFGQDAANGLKQFDTIATSAFSTFENSFADFATGTKTFQDAFKSMTDSIIRDLIRLTLRMSVTGPLASGLSSLFGGGGGFNSLFGGGSPSGFGARASGGPVNAGTPYIVGEHGPELFVPKGSGTIVPNQLSRGGTAAGLNVVVNNYASQDTETTQDRRTGPSGEELIIGVVKKTMAKGGFDDVNRGRYGLRAVKSR